MHQIETGTVLLGFTSKNTCDRCNNASYFQIRQEYVKQSIFFIPVANQHVRIFTMCPVCENRTLLTKRTVTFSGKEQIQTVVDLLESGKEVTKHWLLQLSLKDKEKVLKRLNGVKAYSVVRYLSE